MTGGRKRKPRFDHRSVAHKLSETGRQLIELAGHISELQDLDFLASGSVVSEGDTFLHGSEDEAEAQRQPKKVKLAGNYLQGLVEAMLLEGKLSAEPTNQLDSDSSPPAPNFPPQGLVEAESNALPSSSTQPPPIPCYPPRLNDSTLDELLEWRLKCIEVSKAREKVLPSSDSNPTLRALEDGIYNKAVQDWRYAKRACSGCCTFCTPISDGDGPTGIPCTGFILRRYEHSGIVFSVIVTSSVVVCKQGRLLEPVPKKPFFRLSVRLPDRKTVMEAHLLYFNEHFEIAFLLLLSELSLDVPRFGGCPDYNQEVFVLGRDREASLAVRHGVISWTEESDFMGRDYYMFLDGVFPQGGTGGPVIDHDGVFRGMAFKLSP